MNATTLYNQNQSSPHQICGGQRGTDTCLSLSTSAFPLKTIYQCPLLTFDSSTSDPVQSSWLNMSLNNSIQQSKAPYWKTWRNSIQQMTIKYDGHNCIKQILWGQDTFILKITVFWDMTVYSLIKIYQYFGKLTDSIFCLPRGMRQQVSVTQWWMSTSQEGITPL